MIGLVLETHTYSFLSQREAPHVTLMRMHAKHVLAVDSQAGLKHAQAIDSKQLLKLTRQHHINNTIELRGTQVCMPSNA